MEEKDICGHMKLLSRSLDLSLSVPSVTEFREKGTWVYLIYFLMFSAQRKKRVY